MNEQIWLVCGPRDWSNPSTISDELSNLVLKRGKPSLIVAGDAFGVDIFAHSWAAKQLIPHARFYADWKTYGNGAGPIRNRKMIEIMHPTLCIAFKRPNKPITIGTNNCITQCQDHKIETVIIEKDD